jgi:hypothetical protein
MPIATTEAELGTLDGTTFSTHGLDSMNTPVGARYVAMSFPIEVPGGKRLMDMIVDGKRFRFQIPNPANITKQKTRAVRATRDSA